MEERRRNQKSWQETLAQGGKLRCVLKDVLTPPGEPSVSGDPQVTRLIPTSCEVYVLMTDFETDPADDVQFRNQIVTDEVLTVAVFDKTLPSQPEAEGKTGLYCHVELIDGILELTWIGC